MVNAFEHLSNADRVGILPVNLNETDTGLQPVN